MPISYIIIKLIEVLKSHKKELMLSKWQIERVVDNLLESNCLTDKEKDDFMKDFSLDEEINMFLNNSIYFYDDEDDNIVLYDSISHEDFEYLMDRERESYDKLLISKVDKFFSDNVSLLELFGIKYNKELFNRLCKIQNDIEEEYNNFAQVEMNKGNIDDDLMHKAKLLTLKRNLLYSCMKANLNLQEYEDLSSYSRYLTSANNFCEIPLKIRNDKLENFIIDDPFHRALFFIDNNSEFNLRDKLYVNAFTFPEEKSKEYFYYYVLNVLDKRANTPGNEEIMGDLINAKYRLMCSVDTTYGNFILKNYKSSNDRFIPNYSFIKNEIY